MLKKTIGLIWFLVYLVLGAYFLNSGLFFYEIPEYILFFDRFIRILGGILIIFGGYLHLRVSHNKKKKRNFHN